LVGVAGQADVLDQGPALQRHPARTLDLQVLDQRHAVAVGQEVAVGILGHVVGHGRSCQIKRGPPLARRPRFPSAYSAWRTWSRAMRARRCSSWAVAAEMALNRSISRPEFWMAAAI